MLRKNVRLAKEYLQQKTSQRQERQKAIKKQKLRMAVQAGHSLPTEIRPKERTALLKEISNEDDSNLMPRTHVDDQYQEARKSGKEPRVLITTSRKPTQRLLQFVKELKLLFPGSVRINRGAYLLGELTRICQSHGFSDLIIAHEHNGRPDGLIISHLPFGPTIYFGLSNVYLRHDAAAALRSSEQGAKLPPVSQALPHLIFDGFQSRLGKRVTDILSHLFPVPKVDSHRVLTFALTPGSDLISFRHHTFKSKEGEKDVELSEGGPRFDMRPYQIVLGNVETTHAEKEWVWRPYMRSKKSALS